MLYLNTNNSIYYCLYIGVDVELQLYNLIIIALCFWKINEKKSKRKINNDLAVVASQIPEGAIHDNHFFEAYFKPYNALCRSHTFPSFESIPSGICEHEERAGIMLASKILAK